MNISTLTTGLVLSATLLISGCAMNGIANSNVSIEGNEAKATVKKTVKIGNFNEIEASQGIKVIFTQGANKGTADIATTPSAEKFLKVEVKNNTLKAYYANNDGTMNVKIKGPSIVRVSSNVLKEVDLSSAANVTVNGDLNVNGDFELDLSSAASFDAGKVTCSNMEVDLSSSASVDIENLIGNLEADPSSASSINVGNMKGELDAEASSAASIKISSIKSSDITAKASSAATIYIEGISGGDIKANASSGAKIKLAGKANSLRQNASSGGSVKSSGLTTKN